jgi:hypothetical protein
LLGLPAMKKTAWVFAKERAAIGPAAANELVAKEAVAAAAPGTDTTRPNRKWCKRHEETVPAGTVARRSSRVDRIPFGGAANNPDEGAVCRGEPWAESQAPDYE